MIDVERLSVTAGQFGLQNISFRVAAGQHAVLMGRTGAGKTTLMEAICGLRPTVGGSVRLRGRDVTREAPGARGIGLVPQDGALFPHLSVREHLSFALALRRWDPRRIEERTAELAEWLRLGNLLDRHPQGLSGGEIQRVALGRALSFHPEVLCLDEPLSALDEETREEMCQLLQSVRKLSGVTILHVTHSLSEARRLADCVLNLRDGQVIPTFNEAYGH
ncbi:MAG: ATP-binding cassette domain-containing protein [Verrucomicrobiales bacterium]|nr:ATP-binding cassette domain-containing protein [Verrucomicrobiales bacterium]